MSANSKHLQWIRISASDIFSPEIRFVLGGKSPREWADYGRLMALRQLCACTDDGTIDVGDSRRLASLASDLGMAPKACLNWLAMLADGGAIDREHYESYGRVFIPDIWEAVQNYKSRCAINRKNGDAGGRPKADSKPKG